MKKRFFAVLLLSLCLCAALPASAMDLEPYRVPAQDVRSVYLPEAGGSVLVTTPFPQDAGTPRRLVRVNAQGDTVYDVELPVPEGGGQSARIWQVCRLPDGRDAVLCTSGTGIMADYTLFFVSESGEALEGFAPPPDAIAAMPFEGGIVFLTLKDRNPANPAGIAYVDWSGRVCFEETPPEFMKAGLIADLKEADGRIFLSVDHGKSATVVCADAQGLLWAHAFESEDLKFPRTLLADGQGGVYAAAADATPPSEAKLWRLDAQGELVFERTVRCDPGVIGHVLLMERRGAPVLVGTQTAHSKGYYRCFALAFDENGEALSLDGRDFTTSLQYSYYPVPGDGGAPYMCGYSLNGDASQSDARNFYCVPFVDLPPAQDVNVWFE